MKKFAKMSLVAAVAVAGLSTTSSATALTEAIKGVDVSGYVRYRFTNTENKKAAAGTGATSTDLYKIYTSAKIPVNDAVTAQIGLLVGEADVSEAEANPAVVVKQANFTIKTGVATLIAGKQSIGIPVTDAADNMGTALVAVVPAGPATIVAAHATATNLMVGANNYKDASVTVVGALAAIGGVNVEAWDIDGSKNAVFTSKGIDAQFFAASGNVAGVALAAKHATLDTNLLGSGKDQESTTVTAAGKVGAVSLVAGYHTTGDKGGLVAFDNDAKSTFTIEQFSTNSDGVNDAEALYVSASMPVGPLVATVEYGSGDFKTTDAATAKKDAKETVVALAYSMSKNFKISGFVSNYQTSLSGTETEVEKSRVEVKYTF